MVTPTPVLPPSPMDISALFSGAFTALRRRFGLFILLTLLPGLVTMLLVGIGIFLLVAGGVAAGALSRSGPWPALLIAGFVVIFAGVIVGALFQVKAQAMMCQAAFEIAQGQRPDLGGLFARTRGFLPRIASLIALGFVLVVGFYAAFGLTLFLLISMGNSGRNGSTTALGVLGFIVVILALIPLAIFFSVKLVYTLPAVVLEGRGGIDGLKRSWALTRGSFWRTLGYYLVASIAVGLLSGAVSVVSQLLVAPFSSQVGRASSSAQAIAALTAMIPLLLLTWALQLIVQLFATPFLQAYLTYMFVDQVRRSELPPTTYPPAAPGYYTPPGQYYAHPQQPGYPQPGSPQPGYPQPGYPQQPGWPGQPPQPGPGGQSGPGGQPGQPQG